MDHAFSTIFALLNALLEWSDKDSFLNDTLWQIWDAVEDIQSVYEEKESRIKELEQTLENTEDQFRSVQKERDELELNAIRLSDINDEALADYAEVIEDVNTKAHVRACIKRLFGRDNETTEKLTTLIWMLNSNEDPMKVIQDSDKPEEIRSGLADLRAEMQVDDELAGLGEGNGLP
jgi:chromosome segregation ATPase